jgi:hypothetical protein
VTLALPTLTITIVSRSTLHRLLTNCKKNCSTVKQHNGVVILEVKTAKFTYNLQELNGYIRVYLML